jgi:hypothetical protein
MSLLGAPASAMAAQRGPSSRQPPTPFYGQVRTLVVADGTRMKGSESETSGRLAAEAPGNVSGLRRTHASGHRGRRGAIQHTLAMAGSVDVAQGEAAARLRERCGGLGAMLRFG